MKSFIRVIAIIVLTLFVLIFPISLLMKEIGALLFDPDTTKDLIQNNFLDEENISNLIQASLKSYLSDSSDQSNSTNEFIAKGFNALDERDWREMTSLIAPAALIQQTSGEVVDSIAEWINNDNDLPNLTIELQPWKQNIINNAEPLVIIILDALPKCTASELSDQIFQALNGDGGLSGTIPACNPPEPIYSLVLEKSNGLANLMVQSLPESIDLSQLEIQGLDQLQRVKQVLSQAKIILNWSWVIVLLLALFGLGLAAHGLVEWLSWSGWSIFLAGFGTYFLSKGSDMFSSLAFSKVMGSVFGNIPNLPRSILESLLSGLGESLAEPLAIQAGILIGLGLLTIISAAYIKGRKK